MTGSQRLLAIAIAGTMLLGGFAFGRLSETPKTNAEDSKSALNTAAPVNPTAPVAPTQPVAQASSENQAFFLSDYKTGYADGFNAVANNQSATPINTSREGYNEGYKQGIADAFQAKATPQSVTTAAPVVTRVAQQQQVFRPASAPVRRNGRSKLKTVLTIAAPAAIGAGIGAAAGGGKGAAAGALIGGGGGALFELLKNRNRN